jgi:hypothetical protein
MMQPPPYGNSYEQLVARMRQRVRDQNLEEKILELLQSALGNALQSENLTLARPERERLSQQLSQTILVEVLNKVIERIKGAHA